MIVDEEVDVPANRKRKLDDGDAEIASPLKRKKMKNGQSDPTEDEDMIVLGWIAKQTNVLVKQSVAMSWNWHHSDDKWMTINDNVWFEECKDGIFCSIWSKLDLYEIFCHTCTSLRSMRFWQLLNQGNEILKIHQLKKSFSFQVESCNRKLKKKNCARLLILSLKQQS